MHHAVSDVDENLDGPLQVQECLQLPRCLEQRKRCTRKGSQARLDRDSIQGIGRVIVIQAKRLIAIQR